jgi:hypothetical protein
MVRSGGVSIETIDHRARRIRPLGASHAMHMPVLSALFRTGTRNIILAAATRRLREHAAHALQ